MTKKDILLEVLLVLLLALHVWYYWLSFLPSSSHWLWRGLIIPLIIEIILVIILRPKYQTSLKVFLTYLIVALSSVLISSLLQPKIGSSDALGIIFLSPICSAIISSPLVIYDRIKKEKSKKLQKLFWFAVAIFFFLGSFLLWKNFIMPQNVFEEIHRAELHRAKKSKDTVLSDTEYFEKTKAVIKEFDFEGSTDEGFSLSEKEKSDSPFKLSIGQQASGGGWHRQESKYVRIHIVYVYKGIEFSTSYRYLFDGGGSDAVVSGEGLHILWSAKKDGENLSSYDTSQDIEKYEAQLKKWNLTTEEIENQSKIQLQKFLELWFTAYPKSYFSIENMGTYEVND